MYTNDETPATQDLIGDANVIARGSYSEALMIEDQAEADYAALAMAGDESDLERELVLQADAAALEADQQANDEAAALRELKNVERRYGMARMSAVIGKAWDAHYERSMAEFKAKLAKILEPAPVLVQLQASVAFEQAKAAVRDQTTAA